MKGSSLYVIRHKPTNKTGARREAIAAGLLRYRDGRTCKHGHVNPERLTSCGRCVICHNATKAKQNRLRRVGKKLRQSQYGYDPFDLRCRRKERGLGLSDKKHLVALREKRKRLGRDDRSFNREAEGV